MTVKDSEGLGISLIQSNFHGIGSRIGVDSYGFFLHNRGCGFNLKKGHNNYLQAGKKPLHTLSPTLWTKENKLELILGTRGGRYQPQLLAQMILPYLQNTSNYQAHCKLRYRNDIRFRRIGYMNASLGCFNNIYIVQTNATSCNNFQIYSSINWTTMGLYLYPKMLRYF